MMMAAAAAAGGGGSSILSSSSSSCSSSANIPLSSLLYSHSPKAAAAHFSFISNSSSNFNSSKSRCGRLFCPGPRTSPLSISIAHVVDHNPTLTVVTDDDNNTCPRSSKDALLLLLPKVDKSGRFCSPRAARELALMILYASCLDGSDPVRLFEKRLNARRETGYVFDKTSLMEYNHMSFGGPPVTTQTAEEADEILLNDQKESDIEAEVLSAPPKLVYSKLILRFTRKLLVAVVEKWDTNVLAIDKFAPHGWKNEPAGRILEFSVLHLAMSEIAVVGTRHQIVINEAVDLAKRFCDGAAPRIINGCLRTFVKELNQNGGAQNLKIKQIL